MFLPKHKGLCFSSMPHPWHPPPNGQDAISCHCCLLTIHSSLRAEIKPHLLCGALTHLHHPHFSLCSLNSIYSWACAGQFGIRNNHILPCPINSLFNVYAHLASHNWPTLSEREPCVNKLLYFILLLRQRVA